MIANNNKLKPQSRRTVLLVDDQEYDRELISRVLMDQGLEVIKARDGKEALEKYKSHYNKIDLVITDIVMPGMDGVELVERIRVFSPRVKVLFISGYQYKYDQKVGGRKVSIVPKSDNFSRITEKIEELLDNSHPIAKWWKRKVQKKKSPHSVTH